MMRFQDYDIIMMALARWDGPYSSTAYSLAKELSRHTRVFYVDNPVSVNEFIKKRNLPEFKRRKRALLTGRDFFTPADADYPNLFAITPRITIPANWLPAGIVYDTIGRFNDAAVASTLNHTIKVFGIRKFILINSFNPLFGRYMSLSIKPALTIYQSVDNISQSPYLDKHGPRLENEAIRKANFTIVTSSELKRLKSPYSENVFLLPNAANTKLFRQAVKEDLPVPEEIRKLPSGKKIICYTGNICQRLDYELLKKVAIKHSDKVLMMIGPLARNASGDHYYKDAGLDQHSNVIFTGKKKIEELPAYLKHSHCTIIPFLCNELTKSIYPLKINEYLSAGKPVVTTSFSEDILTFKEVANISESHDAFVSMIEKAIDTDSEASKMERMIFSASNNWEARAHHFIELTVEFLKQHERGTGTGIGKSERRERSKAIYG